MFVSLSYSLKGRENVTTNNVQQSFNIWLLGISYNVGITNWPRYVRVDKVKEMYQNQEIILTADDFNGTTLVQIHDVESDIESEWTNL